MDRNFIKIAFHAVLSRVEKIQLISALINNEYCYSPTFQKAKCAPVYKGFFITYIADKVVVSLKHVCVLKSSILSAKGDIVPAEFTESFHNVSYTIIFI